MQTFLANQGATGLTLDQQFELLKSATGHESGLASVPYDNYLASLHQGEMIMDAGTTASLRRYGIPVSEGGSMSADQADRICDRLDAIRAAN